MQQHEIRDYVERYFQANHCEIIDGSDAHIQVQLTIELDKALMNRPFYWHYLEKTGGTPNPMKMTLIIDQNKVAEDLKGELIHFGSPRLHQIFQSAKQLGSFIRLYEETDQVSGQSTPLQPWLCLNTKISYECDRKKDTILSLGLHLISGQVVSEFHNHLSQLSLTPKIPDYCFTLTPIITPKSGLKRLENVIRDIIDRDDHLWASEAKKRWTDDQALLDHFYEGTEEKPECYHVEKEALKIQYEPKINVDIINGGMFYLTKQSSFK
ncbi:YqhG family protein [Anaerobacillus sp. MEB173]|uniref:YqhG family protein n=1 Tax=Anaerobacillus sp. MEB173 TaxID=3383345 RepID=UPI003F8EFF24